MRRALVIGGDGYVGSRLVTRLAAHGVEVVSLSLRAPDPALPVRGVVGDRAAPGVLDAALAAEPDVVFDLVAYRPTDTLALVARATGRIGRVVHLSTVSVYAHFPPVGPVTEQNARRFEEDGPGYGPQKAACERVLEAARQTCGLSSVILRASPIVGPGDPCSRERYFARRIRAGRPFLHPGSLQGRVWMVSVESLVEAALLAATGDPGTYHLAHDDAPTLGGYLAALADTMGLPLPEIRTCEPEALHAAGLHLYGFAYARTPDGLPDVSAAVAGLGWRRAPYRSALEPVLQELDAKPHAPSWPGRDTTQARFSGTHEWLHAQREAEHLAGVPAPAGLDDDGVLDVLTGAPTGPDFTVVGSESWARGDTEGATGPVITLPAAWRRRLAVRPRSGPPESARIVGALEADRFEVDTAWLWVSQPTPATTTYGPSTRPIRISILPYSIGVGRRPGAGERVLLDVAEPREEAALSAYLRACKQEGRAHVQDPAAWGRMFVVDPQRWGADAGWLLSHGVARLLTRVGANAPFDMLRSPALPAAVALCDVEGRFLAVDVANGRVVELPAAVATVLLESTAVDAPVREAPEPPSTWSAT